MKGPEHFTEGEERMRTSDWQRQEGDMDGAMHEAAMAQTHFLAALVALLAGTEAADSISWQEAIGP